MIQKFKNWLCRVFGHSYSTLDLFKFKWELEGRAYSLNLLTGKYTTITRAKITCRRCGWHCVQEISVHEPQSTKP